MVMVIIFIMTNLPYIVDEFLRQQFVFKQPCHTEFCHVLKVPYILNLNISKQNNNFRPFLVYLLSATLPSIHIFFFFSTLGHHLLRNLQMAAVHTPNHSKKGNNSF
jgi:hypothetical protein